MINKIEKIYIITTGVTVKEIAEISNYNGTVTQLKGDFKDDRFRIIFDTIEDFGDYWESLDDGDSYRKLLQSKTPNSQSKH